MKKLFFVLAIFAFASSSFATLAMTLNVDSAPNVYGSDDWDPWWLQAKDDVAAGTFTNMGTGTYPGTLTADPYDEIVYSTGDLGKRLHWIYYLPGKTVSELDGLFEVKWEIDWGGTAYTLDENNDWSTDPADGWSQPENWEDYDDGQGNTGVIGSLGFAWWADDNDAEPLDTGGSAYDETDQADIDALRQTVLGVQTYALGMIRCRDTVNDPWQDMSLQVDIIPEPATLALLGIGGVLLRRRK